MKLCLIIIFSSIVFLSCKEVSVPENLNTVLTLAGSNKKELLKTIEYFQESGDTLKLAAAYYLIKNLENKYSYTGDAYENLKTVVASFDPDTASDIESLKKVKDNIDNELSVYSTFRYAIIPDAQILSSEFLIDYIEDSFQTFELPWMKGRISFEEFCKYILPYKVGNEPVENWRAEVVEDYQWLLDSIEIMNVDVVEAAKIVNSEIAKHFEPRGSSKVALSFGYKDLKKMKVGSCYSAVTYTLYVMRALGIPVEMEYTPQWGNRSGGHEWVVVHPPDADPVPFDPTYSFQYFYDRFHPKLNRTVLPPKYAVAAKIYNVPFENVSNTYLNEQDVPQTFKQNRGDVTNRYTVTTDVHMKLQQVPADVKYAYLFVFDINGWVPVQISKIEKENAVTFKNMGTGVVYLPGYLYHNNIIPAGFPFICDAHSSIKKYEPKKSKNIYITVYRKYPYLERVESFADRMRDGIFQVSHSPNFEDAKNVLRITRKPEPYFQEANIKIQGEYQYLRYLPADSCYGDVAEIEVYTNKSKDPVYGKIIGTVGESKSCALEKAFDRDKLTYYTSLHPSGSWVGLDFGKSVKIDKIRYLPRNDQNTVEPGENYELLYWDNSWISLGIQIAKKNYLNYTIPENALLWLRNLTRGKEERIFSIENGKQVWW